MPRSYLTIEDFKAGLDSRRLSVAASAGSLQSFINGHINRGGEIEKAKAWVLHKALPAGTFGLAAANNELYVFGSGATPSGFPSGVVYQQLSNPDNSPMTKIIGTETFSGKIYAVSQYLDNTIHHFYDRTIIPDWYVGLVRLTQGDLATVAAEISATIVGDPTVTAGVAGATITLTGKVNNAAFDVTATATHGGTVTDQTITVTQTQAAGASQPEIDTVVLGGTFDAGDTFTINVEDNVYGALPVTGARAASVITLKNKMYVGAGVNLHISAVAAPDKWSNNVVNGVTNTGAATIDMSAQAANDEDITGLGIYQNTLAIYTRNQTQIFSVDADPASNLQLQVLGNIGTRSPKTIKSFGDLDVFSLSDSGVRSLRARDSSNSATVTDVGTPIDDLILTTFSTLTDQQIIDAVAEIEPRDGRYMLALGNTEYVFSFFSNSKISAWSTYQAGFSISDYAILNGRLYCRSGDNIYLLGGANNDQYTTQQVTIELPYLDARSIASWKRWVGIDVVLEGTWDVYVNSNPKQPDTWVKTATLYKTSIGQMNLMMQQNSPVLKFKFVHQGSGAAKLSKLIVHYDTKWAG